MGAGGSVAQPQSTVPTSNSAASIDSFDVGPIRSVKSIPTSDRLVPYKVTLNETTISLSNVTFPVEFTIKMAYESLDVLPLTSSMPLIQFPYQSIICWGSSPKIFQFNAFPSSLTTDKGNETVKLIVNTSQGKAMDQALMKQIRSLMSDMEATAVSKDEFITLKRLMFDTSGNLEHNWLQMVDQFSSTGRSFLAKQGMELMVLVTPHAPFERQDLACLLYERILNKDSYQLIINVFPDREDRVNLMHRLKLDPATSGYTMECNILTGVTPSSPLSRAAASPSARFGGGESNNSERNRPSSLATGSGAASPAASIAEGVSARILEHNLINNTDNSFSNTAIYVVGGVNRSTDGYETAADAASRVPAESSQSRGKIVVVHRRGGSLANDPVAEEDPNRSVGDSISFNSAQKVPTTPLGLIAGRDAKALEVDVGGQSDKQRALLKDSL